MVPRYEIETNIVLLASIYCETSHHNSIIPLLSENNIHIKFQAPVDCNKLYYNQREKSS